MITMQQTAVVGSTIEKLNAMISKLYENMQFVWRYDSENDGFRMYVVEGSRLSLDNDDLPHAKTCDEFVNALENFYNGMRYADFLHQRAGSEKMKELTPADGSHLLGAMQQAIAEQEQNDYSGWTVGM